MAFTAIAAGPQGLIAVGSDDRGPVLWRSQDGSTWESVSELPTTLGASITSIGVGGGRAVVAGTNGDGSALVWVGPEDGRGDHKADGVACTKT